MFVKTVQNLMNLINDRMKLFFGNVVKQRVPKKGWAMTRNRGQENAWQSAHRPLEHVNPELHLCEEDLSSLGWCTCFPWRDGTSWWGKQTM